MLLEIYKFSVAPTQNGMVLFFLICALGYCEDRYKYRHIAVISTILLCVVTSSLIPTYPDYRMPLTILTFLVMFIFSLIMLNGKFWEKSIYFMSIMVTAALITFTCINALSSANGLNVNKYYQDNTDTIMASASFIVNTLVFMVIVLGLWVLKKENLNLSRRGWLIFNIMAACALIVSVQLYSILIRTPPEHIGNSVPIILSTLFLIVVGLYWALSTNSKYYNELMYAKDAESAMRGALAIARQEAENDEYLKGIMHDYKNQIMAIESLANKGDCISILGYIKGLLKSVSRGYREVIKTGNPIIDAVINVERIKCIEDNIDIEIMPDDLTDFEVDIVTFNTLFYNIVDNSIEASNRNQGEKSIKLSIKYQDGEFTMTVKNKIDESVLAKNPLLDTIKKGKYHGIGNTQIKKAVDQLGGKIDRYEEDDYFIVKVHI